ncbi:MAG: hypothetical protein QE493_07070 [Verrucomicrobiae bacterium]|nr:hypothetical protein [Verrucomicrobiae bacterium]
MDTESASYLDLDSRDSTNPVSPSFVLLVLISFARRLMTLQYEISGLIFFL